MGYYIAACKELPIGEFGVKPIKRATKEVKQIRFTNVKLQQGHIPLEQIIDLLGIKEDEVYIYFFSLLGKTFFM